MANRYHLEIQPVWMKIEVDIGVHKLAVELSTNGEIRIHQGQHTIHASDIDGLIEALEEIREIAKKGISYDG